MKNPVRVGMFVLWWCAGGALSAQIATVNVPPDRVRALVETGEAERLAADVANLSLRLGPEASGEVKLRDDKGQEVPARIAGGVLQARIDPRRGYVLAPPQLPRRALMESPLEFPARYITVSPQGKTNLGGLFLRASRVPLVWSESERAYATELFVGYEFLDGGERPLAAPKTVTFFAEGANARIEADTVIVKRSGGSGYQRVRLTTREVEGATRFTARAGPDDELKSSVAVLREPGALTLSLPAREIAGYGIGTTHAVVTLQARDGLPLAATSPIEVQLSSRGLRHPASALIAAGEASARVELRSTGTGDDELSVRAVGLEARLPLRQVFPVAALVAAAAGGALGGATRFLRNKRKGSALLGRRAVEGVLVGVILLGAAWAGLVSIEMSAGVLGTPFGAFVLAALGGYVGCAVLDRVAGRTFGALRAGT